VRNECTQADGVRKVAEGLARRGDAPATLEVRFAPAWLSSQMEPENKSASSGFGL
jgi:hypothetical protein